MRDIPAGSLMSMAMLMRCRVPDVKIGMTIVINEKEHIVKNIDIREFSAVSWKIHTFLCSGGKILDYKSSDVVDIMVV